MYAYQLGGVRVSFRGCMIIVDLKKWVKSCQRWHGEDCEELLTKSELEMPPNFRVIDTWARCIVQAPPHC